MSTHIADRIYQRMLRYEHHQVNYQSSLQYGITPFGLQLKKRAQIETISEDLTMITLYIYIYIYIHIIHEKFTAKLAKYLQKADLHSANVSHVTDAICQ